jgi:hypothetical protein
MDDIRQQLNKVIETATRHATGPEPAELRRRLRRRRQRGAAATVALLLGAGIGLPTLLGLWEPSAVTTTQPAPVRQLACGDIGFPETSLFAPAGAENGRDPAARALAAFLASEAARDPWKLPKTGWKELTRDGDRALYGLGRPGTVTFAVRIRRQGTQWKWVGYGNCRPRLLVPGFEVVGWQVTSKALASGSRVVPIAFTTGACSRFDHAEVATTVDAVTITVYLRPIQLPPGTGCALIGYTTRHEVALPEPLGRRALLDGSTVPAEVIRPA